jgi:hypothetical protein
MVLYYRLMTKRSGLGDSTELFRVGLSDPFSSPMWAPPPPIRHCRHLNELPPPLTPAADKASTIFPRPPSSSHGYLLNIPAMSLAENRAPAGAAATSSPPLAGATTGHATANNRPVVSPNTLQCHMFTSYSRRSPPASPAMPPRAQLWNPEGIFVNHGYSCNRSNLSFFANQSSTLVIA